MAKTHEIHPELRRLTDQYHDGSLNTAEYRGQRRMILEEITRMHQETAPKKTLTVRKVRKAEYIGVALLAISIIALLLFGFKMH